jgi:hypothetical protein
MKDRKEYLNIPLECYRNGDFEIITFEEVLEIITTINFLWLCFKDVYFWCIDGFKGRTYICKKAGQKALKIGFLIHTQQGDPYTLLQAQKDLNNGKEIDDPNLFITWASRFNRIFKKGKEELLPRKYWPLCYLVVPIGSENITIPAYKLNPDYETLVIVGVDRDSAYTNPDVPWEQLSSEFTKCEG